jgi:ribosomal protein S18 acetylase RimI-like enzyme
MQRALGSSGLRRMIRLRSFQKGDLAHLHRLDRICFPPGISYSMAELKYFLVSRRCSCWIAEDTAEDPKLKLKGFIIVERLRRAVEMRGHIVTIDVCPRTRRHGVGKLLIQAAEEQMKREGANLLTLEVAVDNGVARAFYVRMGFSRIGRIPDYYPGKLDADVMAKVI